MSYRIRENPLDDYPIYWTSQVISDLRVNIIEKADPEKLAPNFYSGYLTWPISQVAEDLETPFGQNFFTQLVEWRDDGDRHKNASFVDSVCLSWMYHLNSVEEDKEIEEHGGSLPVSSKGQQIRLLLRLKTRNYKNKIFCTDGFWGWPNPNEFPLGYPIISFINGCEDDPYMSGRRMSLLYNTIHVQRHSEADQPTEEIVVLIATAQKQAEAATKRRFNHKFHSDDRLNVFKPCVLLAYGDEVQLTRASIGLEYLENLESASSIPKDLGDSKIQVYRSPRYQFYDDDDMKKLALILLTVFDDYKINMAPLVEKRTPIK